MRRFINHLHRLLLTPFTQPSKCHPSHAPELPPTSLPPPSPEPPLPHSIHDPTSPTQDHPPETSVSNPTSAPIPASAPIATISFSGEHQANRLHKWLPGLKMALGDKRFIRTIK